MHKRPIFVLILLILLGSTGLVQASGTWSPTALLRQLDAFYNTLPEMPDAPAYSQYVARAGDTYWDIARESGIDVSTLLQINNLKDTRHLAIGQVLYIPQANPTDETLAQATPDLSVVIAVDNTGSMAGTPLQEQVDAVRQLIAGMSADVPVALVTYSDDAQITQPFTTDRTVSLLSLNMLAAGGDAALYDGALTAVAESARSNSLRKLVVVLTDGGDTAQSEATREDSIRQAWANAIPVVAIGIGSEADQAYLRALAQAAHGRLYSIDSTAELPGIVDNILAAVSAGTYWANVAAATGVEIPSIESATAAQAQSDDIATSLLDPTLADTALTQSVIGSASGGEDAPLLAIPGLNGGVVTYDGVTLLTIGQIPPLQDGLGMLDIDAQTAIDLPVVESVPQPVDSAQPETDDEPAITSIDVATVADRLTSNVAPITIEVSESADIQVAELALNGYRLQTFEQAPYQYELDLTMLDGGHYNLTFTVANEGGVMSAGTFEFAVEMTEGATPTDAALRTLLVDGEPVTLELAFSTEAGLTLVKPMETLVVPDQNLLEILSQPANNLIPATVREALTTPRPLASAIIIIVMTLTLLPQGIFTLYWLMYSWNNPKTIEESQSPRAFVEPEISFTALLPARHEEAVIKDTIYAVDRIDYPDHLKEVLILCRTDDQGTIDKANEAVAEIGKSNIRVVTFSTGPINKPHGLNIGLGEATKDVVAVFDAEDEPHPEIYQVINTVMLRDDADVVQSGVQLMNFRSNWFSALNVLEYFFWFKSGLHCFTRQFKVTPLGGNTVFFKRHLLEQIGGWDEQCLTEDADVGIRLTALGARIQIVYDAIHATREETPDTVESFIKQRTRWNQGFYQVFFKGDWARLPEMKQRITALYILLNSLMQAGILLFLPVGLYIALTQQVAVPVALLSYVPIYLLLMQLITNLIGIREFTDAYGERLPLGFRLRMIVAYYPYQLMLAVAAARAVMRYVTQKQSWEKTAHSNLHRQGQALGQA